MPDRLYICQRKVASAVVHTFLNVAYLYNALHIVNEDDLCDEEDVQELCPPIIVYNATTGQLSMPHPKAIIERHWIAAQHLVDLATTIEPWIRDRRRRLGGLLKPEQYLVTLSADEGMCVHHERRESACARLDDTEADRNSRYWPTWPPAECDLVTLEHVETIVKWGRHATLHALRSTAPRQGLPLEPYRGTSITAVRDTLNSGRPHAWLHRMHAHVQATEAATEQ